MEGDSSSTFWWRRWIEHSRSPSAITSLAVAEELDLDVARPLDVALAEDAVVAERRLGLRLAASSASSSSDRSRTTRIPAPAAARRRFDDQREADLVGLTGRDHRDAGLSGDPLCLELVAAQPQRLGARADEQRPAASTASAKSALSARKP